MIEIKWIMIACTVIMLGAFVGMALEQHERGQCRIAAIQTGKNSTEIASICK
jgi:hypothetical protein